MADPPEGTNLRDWRLHVKNGRQTWHYVGDDDAVVPPEDSDALASGSGIGDKADVRTREERAAERLQTMVERHLLGLSTAEDYPNRPYAPRSAREAARAGVDFYSKIQAEDGHWANDYGGPMFLLPGLLITLHISETPLAPAQKAEMVRYLTNMQREDGGWGIHIEAPSSMFGTGLNYVAMRLLGVGPDDERLTAARAFIHKHDIRGIPSWGKFWLATLGCYDWSGLNPIPPELWLLPDWLPVHPHRWWCHCRVVYLPMGYVYGARGTGPITDFILDLRRELYGQVDYDTVDWNACRNRCCEIDVYTEHSMIHDVTFGILAQYEKIHSGWLRQKALDMCIDHIKQEDLNTRHIDIGPVNKAINMLSVFFAEGKSEHFMKHVERVDDYLWLASDGLKMQGYNGSQLWDTAFALQAIVETGMGDDYRGCLSKGYDYLECSQVLEDVPDRDKYYRHISYGAWPFSTRDHGWPISDCTAEGVKATLALQQGFDFIDSSLIDEERVFAAINVILSFQNRSRGGGWATYELQRAPAALELLNPSEVFGKIMVDYEHVECSSACVQALCRFREIWPDHRSKAINASIKMGVKYLINEQRDDGSWVGNWGVCFTYGTWFGVEGLMAAGASPDSEPVVKACKFLLDHQKDDGGWGETFMSCVTLEYSEHEASQIVNTAWAVLTLLAAQWPDQAPIKAGIDLLMSRQLPNGDWAQESISGVFNNNCMISYSAYRNIFPIWALGRYANRYGTARL